MVSQNRRKTRYRSNNRFGTPLDVLAKYLPASETSDPSFDIIVALVGIYQAVGRLHSLGVDIAVGGNDTLDIERLYREALFVRAFRMPAELLDTTTISRLGILHEKSPEEEQNKQA